MSVQYKKNRVNDPSMIVHHKHRYSASLRSASQALITSCGEHYFSSFSLVIPVMATKPEITSQTRWRPGTGGPAALPVARDLRLFFNTLEVCCSGGRGHEEGRFIETAW
jgi:hypothetical protein